MVRGEGNEETDHFVSEIMSPEACMKYGSIKVLRFDKWNFGGN